MQPRCRQVPPSALSFSTTAVFNPRAPARAAAMYPPGPEPMTTTSYASAGNPCVCAGFEEALVVVGGAFDAEALPAVGAAGVVAGFGAAALGADAAGAAA